MHVRFLNIFMFVRNRSLPGPRFRLPELGGTLKAAVVFFFIRSISQAATSATHVAEHCRATVVVQRQALEQSDFALTKTKGVEPLPRGSMSSNSSPRLEVVMSRKGCT